MAISTANVIFSTWSIERKFKPHWFCAFWLAGQKFPADRCSIIWRRNLSTKGRVVYVSPSNNISPGQGCGSVSRAVDTDARGRSSNTVIGKKKLVNIYC